ncbi:MAG TPA: hypothetical protein VFV01_17010 [Spirillospora sp.]|nr:hypothetical protein [Spirillospora sp.]
MADFSPGELATLRRFEDTPFAPEAKYLDMNPLVPTGDIRPADEVVPEPDPDTGTAAEWSAHYLAQSYAAHGLGLHYIRTVTKPNAGTIPVETYIDMGDAYAEAAHTFAVGYLLRHVPDDVARELAGILEMADSDELAYDWLKAAGVEPQHIRSAPTRAESIAVGEARRAEREAQVTR